MSIDTGVRVSVLEVGFMLVRQSAVVLVFVFVAISIGIDKYPFCNTGDVPTAILFKGTINREIANISEWMIATVHKMVQTNNPRPNVLVWTALREATNLVPDLFSGGLLRECNRICPVSVITRCFSESLTRFQRSPYEVLASKERLLENST